MRSNIHFFNENIKYQLRKRDLLRKWIHRVARTAQKQAGEINFIFCDDEYLLAINAKYLYHNTLTDIVTFPFSEEEQVISGDIFISVPRVRENAVKYQAEFTNELHRVMIHGILHLMGYDDIKKSSRKIMREQENACLSLLAGMDQ